jgi:hypothetical protein
MEAYEQRCVVCAASEHIVPAGAAAAAPRPGGVRGLATAVRERERVAPAPAPELNFRRPGLRRRAVRTAVVTSVLGVAALAVLLPGVQGEGPLATVIQDAGLAAPQVVEMPTEWASTGSSAGKFTALLPAGSVDVGGPMNPEDSSAGAYWGLAAELGDGGATAVLSTDGGTAGVVGVMEDPGRLASMLDVMAAELAPQPIMGVETTRKDKPIGSGRAMDLVVVDDDAEITRRTRVIVSRGRLYAIVTTGVDAGAARLDEVHARVLTSFSISD